MQTVRRKLLAYAQVTRLNKPIGILLLLWPTLWALWLAADGVPPWPVLGVFVAGVVLMRSAGCIMNDVADQDFDLQVERTRERPLVTGRVQTREALILAVVLVMLAGQLVLLMNPLTIKLSLVAIVLAATYPFFKRFTYLPQFYLGLAFSWGIPMAFAAVTEAVPTLAWLLLMTNLLWVVVYDTEYAMVDREDDLQAGVRSTAILFGDLDRHLIGVLQGLFLLGVVLVGSRAELESGFYVAVFVVLGLFARQQQLINDRDRLKCFRAFNENHWVGMAVFIGCVIGVG